MRISLLIRKEPAGSARTGESQGVNLFRRRLCQFGLPALALAAHGCARDLGQAVVDAGADLLTTLQHDLAIARDMSQTAADLVVTNPDCGAGDPAKQAALAAYRNAIASATFLGVPQIENQNQLVFPANQHYLGMFLNDGDPDLSRVDRHQCLTNKPLAMVKSYWAFARGFNFPTQVARDLFAHGAILFLALEPWSWQGAQDQTFSLAKINNGDFDAQLENFFRGAAAYGGPLVFSFMHEMNGNWYPWAGDPIAFQKAWIKVHDIAQRVGATNIKWAWIVNADTVAAPEPDSFYPGRQNVDIVGIDGFNWGNIYNWSRWKSFAEIFSSRYHELRRNYGKPVIVGEYASAATGQGGNQASWLTEGFTAMDPLAGGELLFDAAVYFNMNKEGQFAVFQLIGAPNYTDVMARLALARSQNSALLKVGSPLENVF